jgi:hypothetical protein
MDDLLSVYKAKGSNRELLKSKTRNAAILSVIDENSTLNASNAENLRKKISQGQGLSDEEWLELEKYMSTIQMQATTAGVNELDVLAYASLLE